MKSWPSINWAFLIILHCVGALRLSLRSRDVATSEMKFLVGDGCGGEGIIYGGLDSPHKYTLIFLHGYNDTRMSSMLPNVLIRKEFIAEGWRIIMPFAPEMDTVGTRGWASYPNVDGLKIQVVKEDDTGYRTSSQRIKRIIDCETKNFGISPSRIVLGGFSQGGATAYLTALELDKQLLGLFGISCWVPLLRGLDSWLDYSVKVSSAAKALSSVLHLHGRDDKTVKPLFGEISVNFMRSNGINVEERYFDVGHVLVKEEIDAVAIYLAHLMSQPVR